MAVFDVAILFLPGEQQHAYSQGNQSDTKTQAEIRLADPAPSNGTPNKVATTHEQESESQYFGGWVTKENAPDWIMVVITFFGLGIAIWQISEAKTLGRLDLATTLNPDDWSPRHIWAMMPALYFLGLWRAKRRYE